MSKVIKPPSKAKSSVPMTAESAIGTRRPASIIVFRERSAANTSVLSAHLKGGEAKGIATRAGRTILACGHEGAAQPRVYERMGIAVADLDEAERSALEKDEHVAVVAKNEVHQRHEHGDSARGGRVRVDPGARAQAHAAPAVESALEHLSASRRPL